MRIDLVGVVDFVSQLCLSGQLPWKRPSPEINKRPFASSHPHTIYRYSSRLIVMISCLWCRVPHVLQTTPRGLLLRWPRRPIIDLKEDASFILAFAGSAFDVRDMLRGGRWRIVNGIIQQSRGGGMQEDAATLDSTTFSGVRTNDASSEKVSRVVSTVGSNVRAKAYGFK